MKFWNWVIKMARKRISYLEDKQIAKLKAKYNGKNPVMSCDCDGCWLYAWESGILK